MSANVSREERFLYWMLLLMLAFIVLHEILKAWLPSHLAAGLSGLFLGVCAPLLPGAAQVSRNRRILLGGATALAVVLATFAIDTLFKRF